MLMDSKFLEETTILFFKFPENNILHNLYYKIVSIIILENEMKLINIVRECLCSKIQIINECKLEKRILDSILLIQTNSTFTYSYSGHLMLLIDRIESLELKKKIDGWDDIVMEYHKDQMKLRNKNKFQIQEGSESTGGGEGSHTSRRATGFFK
jgi:hypothetical protein